LKKAHYKKALKCLGVAVVANIAAQVAQADTSPFGAAPINTPYKNCMSQGKCGEGKCGEVSTEGKCGEGKCGEVSTEGKCGEGKCGEVSTEGKCGEGKCGEVSSATCKKPA
jgi:uncharacterized low-complexity protein